MTLIRASDVMVYAIGFLAEPVERTARPISACG